MDQLGLAAIGAGVGYDLHRLMVDTYCLQHPDRYCISGKSLAAHLTGAYWQAELGGGRAGLDRLQRWLNGPRELPRPEVPTQRGSITALDVVKRVADSDWRPAIEEWARATLIAYAPLHLLAGEWITAAGLSLGSGSSQPVRAKERSSS